MWDGSAVPIGENLTIAEELLAKAVAARIILEVEIGVVGGEEDGVEAEINDKLYTSSEDLSGPSPPSASARRALPARRDLRQRARRLQAGQRQAQARGACRGPAGGGGQTRSGRRLQAVRLRVHGGSGSLKSEIEDSLKYGVVKMNVDNADTQYAFTRPVAGHMFTNYDGVLKIDGEVGNKKTYDPRSYLKKAEESMAARVVEACNDLKSSGRSVSA